MRFTKMQGAGNDYIYLDCFRQPPPKDPAGLSRKISDRHFGVGSDGLILIGPSERADARIARPLVLVLGAEDKGLRRLTRETCDEIAGLSIKGVVESLNVSAAAAVALYELTRAA